MKPRRQAPSLARRPVARPDPGASPRRDAGRPALLLRYLGGLAALLATLAGPQALRAEGPPDPAKSRAAVEALADGRDAGLESAPLTRDDAGRALRVLADRHAAAIRKDRAAEVEARRIELGGREMPFFYRVHGAKPEGGRSLYLSGSTISSTRTRRGCTGPRKGSTSPPGPPQIPGTSGTKGTSTPSSNA